MASVCAKVIRNTASSGCQLQQIVCLSATEWGKFVGNRAKINYSGKRETTMEMNLTVLGHIGFVIAWCRNVICCNTNEKWDGIEGNFFPALGNVGEGKIVLHNHGCWAKTKPLIPVHDFQLEPSWSGRFWNSGHMLCIGNCHNHGQLNMSVRNNSQASRKWCYHCRFSLEPQGLFRCQAKS